MNPPLYTYLVYFLPIILSPLLVVGALWLGRRSLTTTVLVATIGSLTLASVSIGTWVAYLLPYPHIMGSNDTISYLLDIITVATTLIVVSTSLSFVAWIVALMAMLRRGQRRWALAAVVVYTSFEFLVQVNSVVATILFPHFPLTLPFPRDNFQRTLLNSAFWEVSPLFLLVYAIIQRRRERRITSTTAGEVAAAAAT